MVLSVQIASACSQHGSPDITCEVAPRVELFQIKMNLHLNQRLGCTFPWLHPKAHSCIHWDPSEEKREAVLLVG